MNVEELDVHVLKQPIWRRHAVAGVGWQELEAVKGFVTLGRFTFARIFVRSAAKWEAGIPRVEVPKPPAQRALDGWLRGVHGIREYLPLRHV